VPVLTENPYYGLDVTVGRKYGISALLLSAQQWVESGWNPAAVSPTGAFGISQFEPGTAAAYGVRPGTSPADVASQVTGEAAYLDALRPEEGNSLTRTLEAYNAGPGGVSNAASNGAASYATQIENLVSGKGGAQLTGLTFNPTGAAASEANKAVGSKIGQAVTNGIVGGVKDLVNPILHPMLLGAAGFLLVILGVWVAIGARGRQAAMTTAKAAAV